MLSAHVLHEEVFAVEIVEFAIAAAGVVGAALAAPEAEAEVLGVDVAFPFVFGAEGRGAAVDG